MERKKKLEIKKPLPLSKQKPKPPKVFDPEAFLHDFIAFSEHINEDFLCCICYNLLYKPTILVCNHKFCFTCIEKWSNRESESLQCPMCQRLYPLTTTFTLNNDLEKIIIGNYEKEYKLLSEYKKWEYNNRKFNEIKCYYGNTYVDVEGTRRWTFYFRLKQGVVNNYIEKINIKINANSQGIGGQNAEMSKYPFIYNYNLGPSQTQTMFSLLIFVHWKNNMNMEPTRLNYDIVLRPEGRMLSYLLLEKNIKNSKIKKK